MADRRVGLWLVGACGGVGGTTALGLAALARGLTPPTGLVTALPQFAAVPFDPPAAFVVGGHDIRQTSLRRAVAEMHARANVFSAPLLEACGPQLDDWSANVRPGVVFRPDPVTAALADRPDVRRAGTPREAIERIRADLRQFRDAHKLDQVVVANAASTEPPFPVGDEHRSLANLDAALDRAAPPALPTSSL